MPFCRVLPEVAFAEPKSPVKNSFRNSVKYDICLDIGVVLQDIFMCLGHYATLENVGVSQLPPSYLLSYLPQPLIYWTICAFGGLYGNMDVFNNLYVSPVK